MKDTQETKELKFIAARWKMASRESRPRPPRPPIGRRARANQGPPPVSAANRGHFSLDLGARLVLWRHLDASCDVSVRRDAPIGRLLPVRLFRSSCRRFFAILMDCVAVCAVCAILGRCSKTLWGFFDVCYTPSIPLHPPLTPPGSRLAPNVRSTHSKIGLLGFYAAGNWHLICINSSWLGDWSLADGSNSAKSMATGKWRTRQLEQFSNVEEVRPERKLQVTPWQLRTRTFSFIPSLQPSLSTALSLPLYSSTSSSAPLLFVSSRRPEVPVPEKPIYYHSYYYHWIILILELFFIIIIIKWMLEEGWRGRGKRGGDNFRFKVTGRLFVRLSSAHFRCAHLNESTLTSSTLILVV